MPQTIAATPQKAPRYPMGVPVSWYVVAYSDELKPGEFKLLQYFGEELILFRGESGAVGLIDAYCDHLGAHLAYGGKVVGDTVQCPFHNWRWSGDGRCAGIPYATIIPGNARIRSYPVREHSGLIWAWRHPDGAEPAWELPTVPEFGDPAWMAEWMRFDWTVATHPQEVYENGIDYPHFAYVHGFAAPTDVVSEYRDHQHLWGVSTTAAGATEDAPRLEIRQDGRMYGLGCSFLRISAQFDVVIIVSTTPLSSDEVHIRAAIIGRTGDLSGDELEQLRAYSALQAELITQDFEIWSHKKYVPNPKLCHRDGPIGKFRSWAAQFYL